MSLFRFAPGRERLRAVLLLGLCFSTWAAASPQVEKGQHFRDVKQDAKGTIWSVGKKLQVLEDEWKPARFCFRQPRTRLLKWPAFHGFFRFFSKQELR